MKRLVFAFALAALPLTAVAQSAPPPLDRSEIAVATVDGETITLAQLDFLWGRLGEKTRQQWERAGGKLAFLENYVQRRLLVKEALRKGLEDQHEVRMEVEAARESALFDAYVREVLAPQVLTDEALHVYYSEHEASFAMPERVKLWLIAVSTARRTPDDARAIASKALVDLFTAKNEIAGDRAVLASRFAAIAAEISEHESAKAGGDLGWVDPTALDGKLGEAAKNVAVGMLSGVLETPGGYAILFVEKRQPASILPFDQVRGVVRERLLASSGRQLVEAAASAARALREKADVQVLPENVK